MTHPVQALARAVPPVSPFPAWRGQEPLRLDGNAHTITLATAAPAARGGADNPQSCNSPVAFPAFAFRTSSVLKKLWITGAPPQSSRVPADDGPLPCATAGDDAALVGIADTIDAASGAPNGSLARSALVVRAGRDWPVGCSKELSNARTNASDL